MTDWNDLANCVYVCVFVCSRLSAEQDLLRSPFNKIRVKLPLTGASSSVTQDSLWCWKMFCPGATAWTAADLESYSTVTLTKKGQSIPRLMGDFGMGMGFFQICL